MVIEDKWRGKVWYGPNGEPTESEDLASWGLALAWIRKHSLKKGRLLRRSVILKDGFLNTITEAP